MSAVATTIDRHRVALRQYPWDVLSSRTPKTEQLPRVLPVCYLDLHKQARRTGSSLFYR